MTSATATKPRKPPAKRSATAPPEPEPAELPPDELAGPATAAEVADFALVEVLQGRGIAARLAPGGGVWVEGSAELLAALAPPPVVALTLSPAPEVAEHGPPANDPQKKKLRPVPASRDNPIGCLQEWAQMQKLPKPSYEITSTGTVHDPEFTCVAHLVKRKAMGVGASKADAKKDAAGALADLLRAEFGSR